MSPMTIGRLLVRLIFRNVKCGILNVKCSEFIRCSRTASCCRFRQFIISHFSFHISNTRRYGAIGVPAGSLAGFEQFFVIVFKIGRSLSDIVFVTRRMSGAR